MEDDIIRRWDDGALNGADLARKCHLLGQKDESSYTVLLAIALLRVGIFFGRVVHMIMGGIAAAIAAAVVMSSFFFVCGVPLLLLRRGGKIDGA